MELKGRILLFTIDGCRHCKAAKSKLQELTLPYVEVNLDDFPDRRQEMMDRTSRKTVPQIFFNSKHIGGNSELVNMSTEELQKMIDEVVNNSPPEDAPLPSEKLLIEKSSNFPAHNLQTDELAKLVDEFKSSGIIKDRGSLFSTQKNSFTGKEMITWLCTHKKIENTEALEQAKELFQMHFIIGLSGQLSLENDDSLYRLLRDQSSTALNANVFSDAKPISASHLSTLIRKQILKIYGNYLSEDGKCVDYDGIKKSTEFKDFVEMTGQLQRCKVAQLSRDEKIAFFINIYNALVIHGNVEYGFPSSAWKRYKFFNVTKYRIGGHDYSLQDIENGVLRANRKGVGMFSKPFGKSDPRLPVALSEPEPLMHFALVCGAKSCPPIKTYSAEGIDDQLKLAACSFLDGDDGCVIDMKKKIVKLSKIMDWYQEDFGSNSQEVVSWVHDHVSEEERKGQLSALLSSKNFKVAHMVYDWGSNSKK